MNTREFEIVKEGAVYVTPLYMVKDTALKEIGSFQIKFVRGKGPDGTLVPEEGILSEHLISVLIHDLKHKNTVVPSRETSVAITKLQEALFWLEERQRSRTERGVVGTYKQ